MEIRAAIIIQQRVEREGVLLRSQHRYIDQASPDLDPQSIAGQTWGGTQLLLQPVSPLTCLQFVYLQPMPSSEQYPFLYLPLLYGEERMRKVEGGNTASIKLISNFDKRPPEIVVKFLPIPTIPRFY